MAINIVVILYFLLDALNIHLSIPLSHHPYYINTSNIDTRDAFFGEHARFDGIGVGFELVHHNFKGVVFFFKGVEEGNGALKLHTVISVIAFVSQVAVVLDNLPPDMGISTQIVHLFALFGAVEVEAIGGGVAVAEGGEVWHVVLTERQRQVFLPNDDGAQSLDCGNGFVFVA